MIGARPFVGAFKSGEARGGSSWVFEWWGRRPGPAATPCRRVGPLYPPSAPKVSEVARAVAALRADTVIFDDELSPGQLRNLEKAFSGPGGIWGLAWFGGVIGLVLGGDWRGFEGAGEGLRRVW